MRKFQSCSRQTKFADRHGLLHFWRDYSNLMVSKLWKFEKSFSRCPRTLRVRWLEITMTLLICFDAKWQPQLKMLSQNCARRKNTSEKEILVRNLKRRNAWVSVPVNIRRGFNICHTQILHNCQIVQLSLPSPECGSFSHWKYIYFSSISFSKTGSLPSVSFSKKFVFKKRNIFKFIIYKKMCFF